MLGMGRLIANASIIGSTPLSKRLDSILDYHMPYPALIQARSATATQGTTFWPKRGRLSGSFVRPRPFNNWKMLSVEKAEAKSEFGVATVHGK